MDKLDKCIVIASLFWLPFASSFAIFLYQWLTGKTHSKLREKLKASEDLCYRLKLELDKSIFKKKFPSIDYDKLFSELDSKDIDLSLKSVCYVYIVAKYEKLLIEDVLKKYNYVQIIHKGKKYQSSNSNGVGDNSDTKNARPEER